MAEVIEGMAALQRRIQAMGRVSRGRVLRQSASAAVNPMLQAARANAPKGERQHKTYKGRLVTPGFLRRNVKKKVRTSRDKNIVFITIDSFDEAWYGDLQETGFKGVPPKRWLGRAYNQHIGGATNMFIREMAKRIMGAR